MSISQAEQQVLDLIPGLAITSSVGRYAGSGLDLLTVENEQGRAVIALHGAHVVSFVPAGAEDVLWISPKSDFSAGEAIRGGIPLCLPWFGAKAGDANAPKHGFARIENWTLVDAAKTKDGASRVVLELHGSTGSHAFWPHAFSYRLAVTVGKTLQLDLQVKHLGSEAQQHAIAMHTYFNVGDVATAVISGLEGVTYIDSTQESKPRILHEGPLQLTGPTDRIFLNVPQHQSIKAGNRTLNIDSKDMHCAVVWNAWHNADNIADIGPGNYVGYLCVERADVWDYSPVLQPGETYRASMTLSIA